MFTPPVFHGTPEEDIGDWLLFYERAAEFNGWDGTRREQYLCVALEGNARKWYTTTLRGANTPTTWETWKTALKETFGNRSMREWAHLRLSQRFQLSSEPPEQYFYDVLQLCSRVNENMTEEEKLRQLTRGLRPEVLERVVLTNPQTTAEFLTTLQRLTQASQMAQHNMWTMPTHPLPGFNSPAPQQASQTTRSSQSPSDFQRAALPMTTAPGFYEQPGTSSSLPEVTSLPQLHSEAAWTKQKFRTTMKYRTHREAQPLVSQPFEVRAYDEFVTRGNAALFRCHLPSFAKDVLVITAWLRDDGLLIHSPITEGKFALCEFYRNKLQPFHFCEAGRPAELYSIHGRNAHAPVSRFFTSDPPPIVDTSPANQSRSHTAQVTTNGFSTNSLRNLAVAPGKCSAGVEYCRRRASRLCCASVARSSSVALARQRPLHQCRDIDLRTMPLPDIKSPLQRGHHVARRVEDDVDVVVDADVGVDAPRNVNHRYDVTLTSS
ncbi:hypothetical protein HPB47_006457 [Ixodes persulcatus]|uniref:Uncharacterized protein n=1 Tax=Ixodes persulcatus TaxID=34615 RepID=A0AC60PA97_IXOPE|nr:hypothetical protein HPB47_006457 [Ixodes persulcatus]